MAIQYLKDGGVGMPEHARAKREEFEPNEIPAGAAVISRTATVAVQREGGAGELMPDREVRVGSQREPQYARSQRPDAADEMAERAGVMTVTPKAPQRGARAQPHAPSTAIVPASTAPKVVMDPQVEADGFVASVPRAQKKPTQAVVISSPTLGRHRLRAAQVLVSPVAVAIAYYDDDDHTIFEPPPAGTEQPLTITYDGQDYVCAYHGLSFTQPVLTTTEVLLVVVFVRTPA